MKNLSMGMFLFSRVGACKCHVLGGISNGQRMWEPLSVAHGNGGGIQPKDTSG